MQQDNNNAAKQAMVNKVIGSVFGNVEQHFDAPTTETATQSQETATYVSPVYLAKKRGNKIDIIRIANAIYELGMVVDANGGKLTKKDFMITFGKTFNLDLTDYDKDLSNSMSSSVAYDKQTRIFDEMKTKHQEIYNSK